MTFLNPGPLPIGCIKGQMARARGLLKRGADRMALDSTQRTPLHWAAGMGSLSCVTLLVGRTENPLLTSAEVNAADDMSATALHFAAFHGHEKVAGVLCAMGASLDAKNAAGNTPLQFAQQKHPEKASLLELLSGRGPANPPGTVCDHCGKPSGRKMVVCSACEMVRYCDPACQLAAWEEHKAECEAEAAVRERRTAVVLVGGGGASAA